jgi:glycerol-3-phosphate O-acyltransferase
LEGRAFTSELAGGKKQRESIFGLLKSIKTLREDYGKVYVSIGNPIELDALLDTHHPGWRTEPVADQRPDWFKPVVDNLGNSIMCHINQAASVTPMSILATALLSTPRGCISQSELIRQLEIFQKLLAQTHAGTLVVVPHIDAKKLISHGQHLRFIEPVEDELGVIIQIRAGQTAPLTYFKNNILHLLTLPALVAASFSNQRVQHRDDIDHLLALSYPIVQSELFVPTDLDADTIDQSLQSLRNAGLLKCDGEHWIRAQAGSSEAVSLLRLAQVVSPALERDYLCACILIKLNQQSIRSDELAAQCKRCADRLARIYGRDSNELFDKHLHNSFIDSLHNNGYIECSENVITVKPALLNMESEARVLIPDSSRHAIIATTTSMASIDVNHS